MARGESSSDLRRELEQAIRWGRCAYCRYPGSDGAPLTREHVIPRARGGRRKDVRIIVPACARCNQLRGCRELVLFLLLRPRRISAFLDHLATLTPASLRQLDPRVLAEVYAAIWMLGESAGRGPDWRAHLRRLCSGRTLHRRRYAARRLVGSLASRPGVPPLIPLERSERENAVPAASNHPLLEDESIERLNARLLAILAMALQLSPQEVSRRMASHDRLALAEKVPSGNEDGVVPLDGWRRRQRRKLRIDHRRGRAAAGQPSRGRAA